MTTERIITIEEANIRKAHRNGCSDVRKALETLFPNLFPKEIKLVSHPSLEELREFARAHGQVESESFLKGRESGEYGQRGIFLSATGSNLRWKIVMDTSSRQVLVPDLPGF